MENGPFHEGELYFQQLVGEAEMAQRNGTIVKAEILSGALAFIARQPMVVIGAEDKDGNLWASVVYGEVGFLNAKDLHSVSIDLTRAKISPHDPVLENLRATTGIGTLMMELETRRRLKINGEVSMQSDSEIQIQVKESYPLCPRYIQRRAVRAMEGDSSPIDSFSCGTIIDQPARETISRADTMFLSTSYPKDCIDVSHRGGNRGFIEVIDEQTLRIPDFNGNSMFNSFGNLQQNSNAGTIIIDFASGYAFQAIGKSAVLLDQEDPDNRTGGTGRFSLFKIERWQRYCLPAVELEFFDYSPHIPKRRSQEE